MELKIRNLSKTYANGVNALKNVNLTIKPGLFGLLGPNGAGKSTLMRTLATLQKPDFGQVRFMDVDVLKDKEQVRRFLGYLPQEFGVYPKVSAQELLTHFALLKGVERRKRAGVVNDLLQLTNLHKDRKKNLGGFSGGMKRRFGIAQALLGDPKLLIVDEPTAGLDPEERDRFHNLLARVGRDMVVILSTHIVHDISELCDQMAILNKGRATLAGSPDAMIATLKGKIWSRSYNPDEAWRDDLNMISTRLYRGRTLIHVYSGENPGPAFQQVQPDLKDVYFCAVKGYMNGGEA